MQRVIRISELVGTKNKPGKLAVSRSTIWRWVREGTFVAPFKLGPSTTVWDVEKVEEWLASQATGA